MAALKLSVTEQPPLHCGSIYCEVKLSQGDNITVNYGHMYFVCDLEKKICQYPVWLRREFTGQLKKLGYSF